MRRREWCEYLIRKAILEDCKDKAISVGENSRLMPRRFFKSASIALATKDASSHNRSFSGKVGDLCFAVYQKRGAGGRATIFRRTVTVKETDQNSDLSIQVAISNVPTRIELTTEYNFGEHLEVLQSAGFNNHIRHESKQFIF